MFTIKYRTYNPSIEQPSEGPTCYDECEQVHGPFTLISKEQQGGHNVVYAHNGDDPGMAFGPVHADGTEKLRPRLWVMNDAGATVATYEL